MLCTYNLLNGMFNKKSQHISPILLVKMSLLALPRERHFQDTEKRATIHPSSQTCIEWSHLYTIFNGQ